MSNLSRFWQAVESLPGLAAVGAEWQAMLGADFALVKPFLRARRERAESYPRFDGGLPYEIVPHGDDDFVGVCRESGDTITLTKGQIVVYELNRRLLAERVAEALGIDRTGVNEDWDGAALHVGEFTSAADTRYTCFLAFPLESADIHVFSARLIADKHAPFILLAPTRRWVRRAAQTTMKFHASVLVPLVEAITAARPGQLQTAKTLESFVVRATGIVSVTAPVADSECGKNAFRMDGDVWTLTFANKTIRVKDSLGLKYIAHLLASKAREIDAATLRSVATGNALVKPLAGTEVLDPQGFQAYRAEVEDLTGQLEEAKEFNDIAKQEQLQGKLHAITERIKAAQGLGGRTRRIKDETSNVRTSIKNAISRAIEKQIQKKHSDLARHLDTFIRTGQSLCYSPDPDVDWEL